MPVTPTYETYTPPADSEVTTSFMDCPVDSLHVASGDLYQRFDPVNFPQLGIKSTSIAAPAPATDSE